MKRFFSVIVLVIVILFVLRYSLNSSGQGGNNHLINFYNWGDYIDPDLIKQFEEETGYEVIYETFDSNEAMLTKVQQGGTAYDVIGPSEYMVEVMKESDLLLPLDKSQLTNLDTMNPRFLNLAFDSENQYSVPYFWGTLGIVYDTSRIAEGSINEWEDLWNPNYRGQILLIDGAREVIGIGLQSLGYSLNDEDSNHINLATDKMKALMPNVLAIVADEMKMFLSNREAPIGITFSGEAAMAMENNPNLIYHVPASGSNLWLDNLAIPKNSKNPKGAHALINFLMRPDIAARNAEYIGYATPSEAAMKLMDPEIISDPQFYPDQETLAHLEVYRNLGQEKLIEYNDRFLEIKIEPEG
ncbi:ABC transporter substrate-binding protein [Hutsoniella sourekii]|uniref:ABC transporter substrate-binding protein n=1 Tax=Hutsoniella sourekii TaxID=87650 RepID=UPI000483CEF9|nr:ABC transporter substrate-binding protein [Hutsoniella sourekii]